MFNALILLITLLLTCGEVKSQACATTSPTSKDIYEHSPVDTEAILFDYEGTPGTNISLVLTGELTSAFNLTGEKLVVADPTRLDRSSYPIPSGRGGYDIPGIVTCNEIGSTGPGIPNVISVYMRYINKISPKITSANSVNQPEVIPEGTALLTVEKENSEEDDFERFEYSITNQTSPEFFEIDSSSGVVTLIKKLNYQENAQHILDVELKNIGKDSDGGDLILTDEQTITITVEDYDDLPPLFQPCDGVVCSPLYTSNIQPNDAIATLDIEPGPIKAVDGDTGINATINYEFINGIPADYNDYFEIDSLTGAVSLKKAFDDPALYTIAVKATQQNNAARFAVTYLQVDVSREDNFKPSFADTSYSGSVLDNGDSIIFVYKDGGEELLQLTATDDDDPDAQIIYTFTESTAYQISSEGYIFLNNAGVSSRSSVRDTTLKIKAININADSRSPNRESDEITLMVTVTETTTLQTTEGTTEPETTTTEETTTPDPTTTTELPTTTIEETTTPEPTTTTTEILTTKESTAETTDSTTTPESTTVSITEVTSAPTSAPLSTTSSVSSVTSPSGSSASIIPTAAPKTTPTTSDETTTTGIQVDMVPASTLYGVAAGLSAALILAILIIMYLLWKYVYPKYKDDDKSILDDAGESQSTHLNGAYIEEDETRTKDSDDENTAEFVTFTGNGQITDLDAEEGPVTDLDAVDFGSVVDENVNGETGSNAPSNENDQRYAEIPATDYETVIANEVLNESISQDVEDSETPENAFQEELSRRALEMSAAAAASAAIAKSVESAPSEAVVINNGLLPPEDVREEKVIKEDVAGSTKIVTLKGRGEDGEDVKAVLQTIDTEMAMATQVENTRAKIAVMERLSELDHPNIITYYGSYELDDCLCYATKFAENGSLEDKLKSANLDADTMMHIMSNVGNGLQYLHAKNIIHGKLRAKTIMLDSENQPMLTDFENNSNVLTDFGEDMRWQALEVNDQTSGCTFASDVWSYGTLMWEIVSRGAVPYENVPIFELPSYMKEHQLPQPKGCSDSLFSIMSTCWNKDPKLRPDMYVINGNLSEKLLEDSNELISLDIRGDSNNDAMEKLDKDSEEFPPPPSSDDEMSYTAL